MTNLQALLNEKSANIEQIEALLDSLDNQARTREALSLGRKEQKRLFELAAGRALDLDYYVPADKPPMQEVVHEGRNTLPFFNYFAKVFVRPDSGADGELWGYNRNTPLLERIVGPGYFVALPYSVPGEVVIDYRRIPPRKPAHWPEILRNDQRLSVVVYNGMEDIMRRVSKHVSIGQATKGGKNLPSFFVLCRQE